MASVTPFPPYRRADLVRTIAARLLRCQKQAQADKEWCRTCDALAAEMAPHTTGDAEIHAALVRLKISVEAEMDRLRHAAQRAQ